MNSESKTPELDHTSSYEVAIVGGGMIGGALAVGLAQQGFRVALIEHLPPQPYESTQAPDLRVSAINLASQALLESLGAWSKIAEMRVHPYRRMAVWERGDQCDFTAEEIGKDRLGYFAENRLIQLGLLQRAAELDNLDIISDRKIAEINFDVSKIRFTSEEKESTESENSLNFSWIVAADGVQSSTRERAGIRTFGWSYSQNVLVVTVKVSNADHGETWQQFSPTGPMAFLPLYGDHAELIWYHNAERVKELAALSPKELKAQIQEHFPERLGDIEIIQAASFPIQRMHAMSYSKKDLVLIGDAAHSINPLAGQGVNLGFRDVEALLKLTKKHGQLKTEFERRLAFKKYECIRRPHNALMMSTMDALYFGFSNNVSAIKAIRNAGFGVARKLPLLKKAMLRYAAGVDDSFNWF